MSSIALDLPIALHSLCVPPAPVSKESLISMYSITLVIRRTVKQSLELLCLNFALDIKSVAIVSESVGVKLVN